jgi:glycosyltransferase involved in cell wall biosynthesis
MARLAVVTSSPPDTEGGHLVIARELVRAAQQAGHEARLVVTRDYGFGRLLSSYRASRAVDLRDFDQVISLRYPSYAVSHPVHVCWLNHTMREYYDLWPDLRAGLSRLNRLKESLRGTALVATDRWLLSRNVTRVVAQSQTVRHRLVHDFGIDAEVLWPPPPARPYRCDGYGDYVFTVSRLSPHKRIDLLVRALAEPAARRVKAVVAGEGETRGVLERLAADLGVVDRITFLGRVDEPTLLAHLARCRAVCFTPAGEDYGFVTVEAFASRKAVVTCRDSGGPTDLVADGRTGLVTDPTPTGVALAIAHLADDAADAARMGAAAADAVAALTWPAAVERLVIV